MKRIEEELRVIRQQMEEDYLLHAERISAQNQSIERWNALWNLCRKI